MPTRAETNLRAAALRAAFERSGAALVEPPILQPAATLLDLYGEDIRARAYVTSDALRGEQMLRPDFTVPVVQMHMESGADAARYTYAGEVFRRQEEDPQRANEYVQVGYEVFDRGDPAFADAEVFALISDALADVRVGAITGDIGILVAAVKDLHTSAARKAALLRHIWRPQRFRRLLELFARRGIATRERQALLAGATQITAPIIGRRTVAEVQARIAALRADAHTDPISDEQVALIEALLNVHGTLPQALRQLRDLASQMPTLSQAVDRLQAREHALSARGIATETLVFEASYGRTTLEYYDGFVFGFRSTEHPEVPILASGGRYDALTKQLGQGREIPAVGGVIRPGILLALETG
ncbi:MAG: ATP phosphoribosyltransferase regulatory subunit [Pseudomonadota bacterium]